MVCISLIVPPNIKYATMEVDTNLRTIGCRVEKLIPDAQMVADIRMAAQRVH